MGKFIARNICLLENTTNNKFIYNCTKRVKISGPLKMEETGVTETSCLKYIQDGHDLTSEMEVRGENTGIWRCIGKIEG